MEKQIEPLPLRKYISYFQKSAIIGNRILELEKMADPAPDIITENKEIYEIAEEEFDKKKISFQIFAPCYLNKNNSEEWVGIIINEKIIQPPIDF